MKAETEILLNKAEVARIREDFPVLKQEVNGHPLIYFDNAASAQKPMVVIDRIRDFYMHEYSNIHRGVHALSQNATEAYEATRGKVQALINAEHEHEVIFTAGTTEATNLVSFSFERAFIQPEDEIICSGLEHHANIIPWQEMAKRSGAKLLTIPVTDAGELDLNAFADMLSDKTKLVALAHVSNTLGTINPVEKIIEMAHNVGAKVLLDGAQAVPHLKVDVQALDVDFYCFSAHKMCGPTGFGVLYGKESLLNAMPPWLTGGDMIETVTLTDSTWAGLPHKFEAGTPNIAAGVGFSAAIDYLTEIGLDRIAAYEDHLLHYGTAEIKKIEGITLFGTSQKKAAVLSFLIDDVHPYDVGVMLDAQGIAVRTGHHCTQPLMTRYRIPGTVRASFAFYNTTEEIDQFIVALKRIIPMLRG